MKKFIEFKMRVYSEIEAEQYDQKQEENSQSSLNLGVPIEMAEPPRWNPSRIKIDASLISNFIAVFSADSIYADPELPELDCTEITLTTGERIIVDNTFEEVDKLISDWESLT